MHARRWLVFTGSLLLLLALGTPAYQHWVLGAASSMETGLLWLGLFAASLLAGVAALLLAIPSGSGRLLRAGRWFVQAVVVGILALHAYFLVTMTHTTIIGPASEVIVPDGYSGTLGIRIRNPVEPGRATIGKTYVYTVPPNGLVDVDSGWIAATFRFDRTGASVPDLYTTWMRWANGSPLNAREFSCTWVYERPTGRVGTQTSAPPSRQLAMACAVRPDELGRTSISQKEADQFFRSHAGADR